MVTRTAKLSDYGVFPEDEKKLKEYCQTRMGIDDRQQLFRYAISETPGLEVEIYESIVQGIGYRTLINRGVEIPIKEEDFYAYRRKVFAKMYDWLRINRKLK